MESKKPVTSITSRVSVASKASKASKASTASTASNKVLIITYYWPPSGGAGVQRWLKFAKYLPEYGWEPVILTIDPDYAAYPVMDESLTGEIPGSLEVYTTPARNYFSLYGKDRSKIPSAGFAMNPDNSLKGKIIRFIRGNFFIPDPRKGWNRFAFKKASELIRSLGITNVITTSPPHSTQLIGLKLKNTFKHINWIADLRDPWTDIYYYRQFYPTFIARGIDSSLERKVLEKSDSIITVGSVLKEMFISKFPASREKTVVITNGYDHEDFTGNAQDKDIFTITYTGTLSDDYPVEGFIRGLEYLTEKNFIIRFVGFVSPAQRQAISKVIHPSKLQFMPYAEHKEAVRLMRESALLLLIIPDHPSSKSILTGKLFEYLASGKPVICLGPANGEAAKIVELTGHGKAFTYNNSDAIGRYLREVYSSKRGILPQPAEYSRKELAGKLVTLLQQRSQ